MIELPLIFVGGLLGSAHCIGMCGGFAVTIGSREARWRANLRRQLIYSSGRIFTYAVGGAAAGYAGLRVSLALPIALPAQAMLALFAGTMLIVQGLLAAGVIRRTVTGGAPSCLAGGMLGPLLASPGSLPPFLAGVLTGFLPCGLVYAYLALATSGGNMLAGLAIMAAFGLGTVPAMVATGTGAALFGLAARRRMFRVAAWCIVLTGLIAIARGAMALSSAYAATPSGACPLCQ